MIRVNFTPRCQSLLSESRVSKDLAVATVHAQHLTTVDSRHTRLIACNWVSDDLLVLVDGEVSGGEESQLEAQVVLAIRRQMPAGSVDHNADAETILAVAAESFGYPLTCDSDEPLSTLYSGAGSRQTVVVHSGCIPQEYWLVGSFDENQLRAEWVWAFRPDRYLAWVHSIE